jgi:hypothetical protein
VKGHSDRSNNVIISASQFQEFMGIVMKEFEDLKASMRVEKIKLAESIKAVSDKMTIKSDIENKKLSDSLTKQFREEHASRKKEISSKLTPEIASLTEAIGQLRKDTDIEVISLSHNVDTVQQQLNDKMNEKMGVAQKQIERVSQEINTRTRDLAADLSKHIAQTSNDVVAVRQEITELGEQVSGKVADGVKTVSDNVIGCTSQILAEKESNAVKFQKKSQEIVILKARVATMQASEIHSVTEGNTEQNKVTKVNGASQNASIPSGSVSKVNVSQNVSSCIDITNDELSYVDNTTLHTIVPLQQSTTFSAIRYTCWYTAST